MKKGEPVVWTEGPGNRLRELWAEGLTAEQCSRMISKQFGIVVTRNAVISRIHRWQLPPRSQREAQKRTRVYAPRDPAPPPPPEPEPMKPEPVPTAPVRLVDANPHQCRFPLWTDSDPGQFPVCGAPTVESRSWCSVHLRRVISPVGPRKVMVA